MYRFLRFYGLLTLLLGCGGTVQGDRITTTPVAEQGLELPMKSQLWIFVMAGQSNMAGRGTIESRDNIRNDKILTINSKNDIVLAQEPLHFYEPSAAGLDSGMSFGTELLNSIPENVSILLIPTAVGGSSIGQWINDETHREVKLLSNFKQRVQVALRYGVLKGILWHQGESDAHKGETIRKYQENIGVLFTKFREIGRDESLPIIVGKLGSFSRNQGSWDKINTSIVAYALSDDFCEVIETSDLEHKGDYIHFNSAAQRLLGKRYAQTILKLLD